MALSTRERAAMLRAIHSNGAALVERVQHGTYLVPSASRDERYVVTGTSIWAAELHCTCHAGQRGVPCWHRAAVQLRKAGEDAKRQVRQMAPSSPVEVESVPIVHTSTVQMRINGVEYAGSGRNLLDAIGNATATR